MATIKVTINKKTAVIKIETEGFNGAACLKATEELRKGLGITTEPELTGEYYTQDTTTTTNLEQGS